MKVTAFVPCYVDACHPGVGVAMVTVLERLGVKVSFRPELTCCGQPAFNAGCWDAARSVAERVLDCLDDDEPIVIPSGSCTAMMRRFYADLFAGHPREAEARALSQRCHEFSAFLADTLKVTDVQAAFPHRATFHDGCHGLRELKIQAAPRRLLGAVRGLELIEMEDRDVCCGFGGLFSVKFPSISTAMGEQKLSAALACGVDYMISNDMSCLMHLNGLLQRRGLPLKTIHLAEVLAAQ